jgi:hypothetical protein
VIVAKTTDCSLDTEDGMSTHRYRGYAVTATQTDEGAWVCTVERTPENGVPTDYDPKWSTLAFASEDEAVRYVNGQIFDYVTSVASLYPLADRERIIGSAK